MLGLLQWVNRGTISIAFYMEQLWGISMSNISIDNLIMRDDNHLQLCRSIFKVLHCNLLWVMKVEDGLLNMLTTDQPILQHYWDEKYYLNDPSLQNKINNVY